MELNVSPPGNTFSNIRDAIGAVLTEFDMAEQVGVFYNPEEESLTFEQPV